MNLHTVSDGSADAPVLVLGPSLGTDTAMFDAQVAAFADRYRVIRFDLPGHGGSPDPTGPITIGDLAEAVLSAVGGVERFHYAGVSIGGAIGQWLGVHHPDRLLSLTVMATAAQFAEPDSWGQRAAAVRANGTEAMVASRPGTWFTTAFAQQQPARADALLDMLRATSAEGYAACCEAIGVLDLRGEVDRIPVPTLVVAGADDPATPVDMVRLIADRVPGAGFVVLPGAHLINVEASDGVNAALAAHLSRTSADVA
jgi:3-oxoadipate enol-lactonase